MMENVFFQGACTALVTPFLGNSVNYPMMLRLLPRQPPLPPFPPLRQPRSPWPPASR